MTRSKRRKMQRSTGAQLAYRTVRTAPIASAALLAAMSTAYGQEPTTSSGLEEIIVTAQKREESMQRVPLAIQAIGTQRLEELNVTRFDDFVKFLPSVSYQSLGPGFAQIYMRGVASGGDGNHSGSQPSVGVYLDEQPITTIQGPLDLHMYDIQRVEALAGPQGTLFGASSQSGTLRIITNKPDPTGFDAGYGVELNTVTDGDLGYLGEGFVNIPLADNMAVRLVGWARHDAGYIDNVRSDRVYPTSGIAVDNSRFIEDDYNDVDTYGARAALRIELNDSWTVTPTIMGQVQDANGSFAYDRTIGKMKVAHTRPELSEDAWAQAALTVEGKLANFDLVYSGGYMFRDVDTESDYQDYSFWYDSLFGSGASWYDDAGEYVEATQYIQGQDNYTKQSHELRLVSPQDGRFRYTLGAFWQKQFHSIEQRYIIDDFAQSLSVTGWEDTIWLTQQNREDLDYAVFGQADFDITEKLTATVGLRYFWTDNSLKGFFGYGAGFSSRTGEAACTINEPEGADGPNFEDAPCLNLDRNVEQDDHSLKLGMNYKFTDDKMVYAIYAEGFRPGGINRRGTLPPYLPDFLDSYELGWKTSWADNRLRLNGAFFFQEWNDFQYSLLGENGLTEITNAAQAEIKGFEADLTWIATDQLSLTAAVSILDSELTKPYCGFTDPATNRPVSVDPCPDLRDKDGDDDTTDFVDPDAPKGQRLPVTPEFKGNMTARYLFPLGSFDSYMQGAVVYVGERESDLRTIERGILGKLPSYTTVDLSAGIGGDGWNLEVYFLNAFDELGEVYRFSQCAEQVCGEQAYSVITPPRTIGVKFSHSF